MNYRERAIIIDDRLHIICIANLWVATSLYSGSIVVCLLHGRADVGMSQSRLRSDHHTLANALIESFYAAAAVLFYS